MKPRNDMRPSSTHWSMSTKGTEIQKMLPVWKPRTHFFLFYRKELRKELLENLQWMRAMKKDPTFKKVMETQKELKDSEGFEWLESTQGWKEANIVPVFEKGEAEYIENYRPISLLPLVSKVLERCVLNRFKDRLPEFIKAGQRGFLQGKSCTSNLLGVLYHTGALLDKGGQVDMVYIVTFFELPFSCTTSYMDRPKTLDLLP